jgi:DNA-binding IclR family transcriptional regulator
MSTLNTDIVKVLKPSFLERLSAEAVAERVGEEPEDVLHQLQLLLSHGFVLRWSDGKYSLSSIGARLQVILTQPIPRVNGRPPSL